jgi:hypothetical protein
MSIGTRCRASITFGSIVRGRDTIGIDAGLIRGVWDVGKVDTIRETISFLGCCHGGYLGGMGYSFAKECIRSEEI